MTAFSNADVDNSHAPDTWPDRRAAAARLQISVGTLRRREHDGLIRSSKDARGFTRFAPEHLAEVAARGVGSDPSVEAADSDDERTSVVTAAEPAGVLVARAFSMFEAGATPTAAVIELQQVWSTVEELYRSWLISKNGFAVPSAMRAEIERLCAQHLRRVAVRDAPTLLRLLTALLPLPRELEQEQERADEMQAECVRREGRITELEGSIAMLQQDLSTAEERLHLVANARDVAQERAAALDAQCADDTETIGRLVDERDAALAEVRELRLLLGASQACLAESQRATVVAQATAGQAQQQLAQVIGVLGGLQPELRPDQG